MVGWYSAQCGQEKSAISIMVILAFGSPRIGAPSSVVACARLAYWPWFAPAVLDWFARAKTRMMNTTATNPMMRIIEVRACCCARCFALDLASCLVLAGMVVLNISLTTTPRNMLTTLTCQYNSSSLYLSQYWRTLPCEL